MAAARRHLEELLVKNADYVSLNEALDDLEEVREQIRKQIEELYVARGHALDEPEHFVQELKEGTLSLPKPVHIPLVPTVDFGKYNLTEEEQQALAAVGSDDEEADAEDDASSSRGDASPQDGSERTLPAAGEVVRGRVYDPEKPVSFNRLWSDEEQARLEKLLELYGEEDVAAHRWTKIARALGNRTPKQVASRTQKYFQKLTRLGLPLPGAKEGNASSPLGKRDAPADSHSPPPSAKRQQTSPPQEAVASSESLPASSYYAPPPVHMPDLGGFDGRSNERVVHLGFKCDGCECEPITGVRFKCQVCEEVDLCEGCEAKGWTGAHHRSSHPLTAVTVAESPFASDPLFGEQAVAAGCYLDPTMSFHS
eukprot:TRINITY_DN3519_c0_g1_i2.p1 TRINITY_DN3519_c0_g1~~TRINITY_DN3519_c0_g1_i2.p1  ORF type:complete len:368 (+),score=129.99 TRINITY_DN3519_c0_g1_i2:408-1511(+)